MTCQVVENQGRGEMAGVMNLEGPGLLRCHCSVLCLALWKQLSGRMANTRDLKIPFLQAQLVPTLGLKASCFASFIYSWNMLKKEILAPGVFKQARDHPCKFNIFETELCFCNGASQKYQSVFQLEWQFPLSCNPLFIFSPHSSLLVICCCILQKQTCFLHS